MKKLLIILLLLARCDDAHKFKWRDEDIKYCRGHTDVEIHAYNHREDSKQACVICGREAKP